MIEASDRARKGVQMTEGKQGAAEWLRGIIGEYEADGERSCSAMARMFGIDCDYETCRGCMVKMMTAIADRIDADRELPEGIAVELPRDAEGREIPLDTEVLYAKDGTEVEALGFVYTYIRGEEPFWHAKGNGCLFYPSRMHLTPPDSWEKLLEDLDRSAAKKKPSTNLPTCNYFGANDCSKCPASKSELLCGKESFNDIADRIRKLRGDDA